MATGIKPKDIIELGKERLGVIVKKIENNDVKNLGQVRLSSMMAGVQNKQIKELESSKKVTIVSTLKANFFKADTVDFKKIESGTEEAKRPTIKTEKIGTTKIHNIKSEGKSFMFKIKLR